MDENMLDIDNDDLLGDSPDLDAEKLEAISQLSPANAVITIDAPSTHPPSKEKAVLSHQEPIPDNSKNHPSDDMWLQKEQCQHQFLKLDLVLHPVRNRHRRSTKSIVIKIN
ncbi:hypothetical protein YC2023_018758 [Brassica napus]